jgi:hypothetical protein
MWEVDDGDLEVTCLSPSEFAASMYVKKIPVRRYGVEFIFDLCK